MNIYLKENQSIKIKKRVTLKIENKISLKYYSLSGEIIFFEIANIGISYNMNEYAEHALFNKL